ncbi:hypothetical protein AB0F72_23835 [Actinoplanes sp. NPDC023936]|uniref:hypothetical protein n=1 Tax=Actinoplanes sp. NPDC023936 TaxID=3154910 RepID=UPI0033E7C759
MAGVALAAIVTMISTMILADRELPSGEVSGEVVRVGVVEGQSVDGYLDAARHEVAALPGAAETWALVSLRSYAAPGLLPALLAGATVAQVYVRVPLADARTPITRIPVRRLPGDVIDGMLAAAVARDQEQAEYEQLSRALTGDGHNEQRLRAAYRTAAHTAAEEAAAYRAGCDCVFAAVVRAAPAVLSGLAGTPVVRAVDPAPEVRELERTEFRPPLPEETGTASAQPSSPSSAQPSASPSAQPSAPVLPSASPAVAETTPAPIPSSVVDPVTSASPESSAAAPPVSVLPSAGERAVPSAADASPVRDGLIAVRDGGETL